MSNQSNSSRRRKSTSFRMGRVRAYLRGRVWYLCYLPPSMDKPPEELPMLGPKDVVRCQWLGGLLAHYEWKA